MATDRSTQDSNLVPGKKWSGHGPDGLTDRQRYCVTLMARGATNQEIAKALDTHHTVISSYRTNPLVRAAVLNAQADMITQSAERYGEITEAGNNALRYLDSVVNDDEANTRDRVNAAKALLVHSTAFSEQHLLSRQIANLERKLFKIGEDPEGGYLPSIDGFPPTLDDAAVDVKAE